MNNGVQNLALGHDDGNGSCNADHESTKHHVTASADHVITGVIDTASGDDSGANADDDAACAHLGKIPSEFDQAEDHNCENAEGENTGKFGPGIQFFTFGGSSFFENTLSFFLILFVSKACFRIF